MSEPMPEWPNEDDFISIEPPDGHEAGREDYERARAEAAMARLRLAVEALQVLRPALWLDHRYATDDDDKDALLSRATGVDEALRQIGPLP